MAEYTLFSRQRALRAHPWTRGNRVFGFDPELRRLWIAGQRLHHGVTGIAVLGAGLAGMLAGHTDPMLAVGWTLAGSAMVAHDWKDRAVWFRRGPQSH
jgi:hypothetical protein